MSLSRKHYIAIAEMLKDRLLECGDELGKATQDNWYGSDVSFALGKMDEVKTITIKISDILKADNSAFDRVRFSEAVFASNRPAVVITKAQSEAAEAMELLPGELTKDIERPE
tara:strand:- start:643 stop:981 length:339 start_codon:yes stop_codon:yes gene_type:complete